MAKCPSCLQPAEGVFCSRCGASLPPPRPFRAASVLCYSLCFVTCTSFLLLPKYLDNQKVRFHA